MQIRRQILTVELAVILSMTVTASAQELLKNGSFEDGLSTTPWDDKIPPAHWQKDGNWGWAGWKNDHPAHTGTRYVDAGGLTPGEYGEWYQDIEANPEQSYICRVWATTEGWEDSAHASVAMEFRDSSGRLLRTDRSTIFNGTSPSPAAWNAYTFTTDPAPASTISARFLLRAEARCSAMFDDASVIGIAPTIEVNPTRTFQTMDGFGASLTDSSAYLMWQLKEERHTLMVDLFDPNVGIGLSYLRQPMGTSEFSVGEYYTYDGNVPPGDTDYQLMRFSIDRDREYIIPLLKEALLLNPRIKIMGSPWSAPAWMKDSRDLKSGRLIDSNEVYDAYAAYFMKYIQAYQDEGIAIDAVTLQNEPENEPCDYPCMRMERGDQTRLAVLLGQIFQAHSVDTKILVWDHNWDNPDYPIDVLKDPDARRYVAGTAFHGYQGDVKAQLRVVREHPDKDIYFTECSGYRERPHFGDNLMWDVSTLVIQAVRCYAKTVVKWNLALNESGGPKKFPGGCGDCRGVVTIDPDTGRITREVEFYSLGHASKFVMPGARRIDSTERVGSGIENVAFINPDGMIVVIVLNPSTVGQDVQLRYEGQSFLYGLPARSVATFLWFHAADAAVDVWMTTADQSRLLEKQPSTRLSGSADTRVSPLSPAGGIDPH